MTTPETTETTTVKDPNEPTPDGTNRPARRIRLPILRRGRIFDAAPYDQDESTERPALRIPLPLIRRGRSSDTVLFDQANLTERPALRIPLPLLRRRRTVSTVPLEPTTSVARPEAPATDVMDPPPRRIPRPSLRGRRVIDTAPFEPTPAHTVENPTSHRRWQVEPTHRLEGFELRSVARAAVRAYACAFIALALGVVLVWIGASMLGIVGRVEEFMRSIGFRDFHFVGYAVIAGGIALCVAGVVFLTVMTVLAAAIFNALGRPERAVGVRLAAMMPAVVAEESSRRGNGNGNGNGNRKANGNGKAYGNGNGDGADS